MANRYEDKSNAELIELLHMRDLPRTGKKTDFIARLRKHDRYIRRLKSTLPKSIPDLALIKGRLLLYNGHNSSMASTVTRIQQALLKNNSFFSLVDISHVPSMNLFWNEESKGRRLPALVKQGRVIGVSSVLLLSLGLAGCICLLAAFHAGLGTDTILDRFG